MSSAHTVQDSPTHGMLVLVLVLVLVLDGERRVRRVRRMMDIHIPSNIFPVNLTLTLVFSLLISHIHTHTLVYSHTCWG